jgi:hypothetical protein
MEGGGVVLPSFAFVLARVALPIIERACMARTQELSILAPHTYHGLCSKYQEHTQSVGFAPLALCVCIEDQG